jgi:hypothetical protein
VCIIGRVSAEAGPSSPLQPLAVIGDDVVHVRALDGAERFELERWTRVSPLLRTFASAVLLLGLAVLVSLLVPSLSIPALATAAIFFARRGGWSLVTAVRERLAFRRDLRVGEVLVVRSPRRRIEMLVHSRSLWTSDGDRAAWRSQQP